MTLPAEEPTEPTEPHCDASRKTRDTIGIYQCVKCETYRCHACDEAIYWRDEWTVLTCARTCPVCLVKPDAALDVQLSLREVAEMCHVCTDYGNGAADVARLARELLAVREALRYHVVDGKTRHLAIHDARVRYSLIVHGTFDHVMISQCVFKSLTFSGCTIGELLGLGFEPPPEGWQLPTSFITENAANTSNLVNGRAVTPKTPKKDP